MAGIVQFRDGARASGIIYMALGPLIPFTLAATAWMLAGNRRGGVSEISGPEIRERPRAENEIDTEQPGAVHAWHSGGALKPGEIPGQPWTSSGRKRRKRMRPRWRMPCPGLAIGTFSASLWTIPAAYFALRAGYTDYGVFNAAAPVLAIAEAAGIMHRLGIRQERVVNTTAPEEPGR